MKCDVSQMSMRPLISSRGSLNDFKMSPKGKFRPFSKGPGPIIDFRNVWYDGRSKVYATQKIEDQNIVINVDKKTGKGLEEFTVGFKLTRTFDPQTIWDCYRYMENPEAHNRPNFEIHTALDCLLKVRFSYRRLFLYNCSTHPQSAESESVPAFSQT